MNARLARRRAGLGLTLVVGAAVAPPSVGAERALAADVPPEAAEATAAPQPEPRVERPACRLPAPMPKPPWCAPPPQPEAQPLLPAPPPLPLEPPPAAPVPLAAGPVGLPPSGPAPSAARTGVAGAGALALAAAAAGGSGGDGAGVPCVDDDLPRALGSACAGVRTTLELARQLSPLVVAQPPAPVAQVDRPTELPAGGAGDEATAPLAPLPPSVASEPETGGAPGFVAVEPTAVVLTESATPPDLSQQVEDAYQRLRTAEAEARVRAAATDDRDGSAQAGAEAHELGGAADGLRDFEPLLALRDAPPELRTVGVELAVDALRRRAALLDGMPGVDQRMRIGHLHASEQLEAGLAELGDPALASELTAQPDASAREVAGALLQGGYTERALAAAARAIGEADDDAALAARASQLSDHAASSLAVARTVLRHPELASAGLSDPALRVWALPLAQDVARLDAAREATLAYGGDTNGIDGRLAEALAAALALPQFAELSTATQLAALPDQHREAALVLIRAWTRERVTVGVSARERELRRQLLQLAHPHWALPYDAIVDVTALVAGVFEMSTRAASQIVDGAPALPSLVDAIVTAGARWVTADVIARYCGQRVRLPIARRATVCLVGGAVIGTIPALAADQLVERARRDDDR